jgi:hypothetical protein
MSGHENGGQAFPCFRPEGPRTQDGYPEWSADVIPGMTMRDYFAAKELGKTGGVAICDRPESYDRLADHCYRMADAMLRARGAA